MALAELAVELIAPVIKLLANFFIEVVVEVLIRGAGFIIAHPFSKKLKPDDGVVLFIGIMFWATIILAGLYFIYK